MVNNDEPDFDRLPEEEALRSAENAVLEETLQTLGAMPSESTRGSLPARPLNRYLVSEWVLGSKGDSGEATRIIAAHEVHFGDSHVIFVRDTDNGPFIVEAIQSSQAFRIVQQESEFDD